MNDYERVSVESASFALSARRKAVAIVFVATLLVIGVIILFVPDKPRYTHRSARIPAEDQAYFDALGPPINDSGPSMDALLDLYDAAQKNPSVVKTEDWQTKAKTACAALDRQGKALENVAPVPADCLQTRKDAILTGQQMRLVVSTFTKASNPQSLSQSELSKIVPQIDEVTRLSEIIADDANKIRAKYGVASTKPESVNAGK